MKKELSQLKATIHMIANMLERDQNPVRQEARDMLLKDFEGLLCLMENSVSFTEEALCLDDRSIAVWSDGLMVSSDSRAMEEGKKYKVTVVIEEVQE